MEFGLSKDYNKWSRINEKTGKKYGKVPGITWFTNLDVLKRHQDQILYKTYNATDYPKYDNYDAININKAIYIPKDYFDAMGVPITFLDKYNPNQFEILGLAADKRDDNHLFIKGMPTYLDERHKAFVGMVIKGKATYARIIIKRKVV